MYPALLFKTAEDLTIVPIPHAEVCPYTAKGELCSVTCQSAIESAMEWIGTHAVDHTADNQPLGKWDWEYRAELVSSGLLNDVLAVAHRHSITRLVLLLGNEPITLVMENGETFQLLKQEAVMSRIVKEFLDDLGETTSAIPILKPARGMKYVVEYLSRWSVRYPGVVPEINETAIMQLDDWDRAFAKRVMGEGNEYMAQLIVLANHFDLKMLVEVLCIELAGLVKGLNNNQINQALLRTKKPLAENMKASGAIPS